MQKRLGHREGRQRLAIVLGGLGSATSALAMALVLVFYGPPYNPLWWWVMGAVLIASGAVAVALVPLFEWVIKGYLSRPEHD